MSVSEVSKNEIVPIQTTGRIQKNYLHPEHTWVWLEDYLKHWGNNDAVKSAKNAGEALLPQVGRTKYKVYRYSVTGKPDVLTSDNSYVEQGFGAFFGHTVAFYWDKKPIKEKVEKAIASYMKKYEEDNKGVRPRSEMEEYIQTNILIGGYLRARDFPEKSLLVRLDNYPTFYERHDYVAYAPVKGYYMSAPELQKSAYGEGYDFHIYFNNKKTDKCPQFVESHRVMKGGVFTNGGVVTKWEGTTQPFFIHNLIGQLSQYPPATEMLLCDCVWTITKDKGVPIVEKTVIQRTKTHEEPYKTYSFPNGGGAGVLKDTYPSKLKDLKRLEFAKELSEKVFHPDRVARLMGDTWGTEDSWLAQVM